MSEGLSEAARGLITTVLHHGKGTSPKYFDHQRLGLVYRSFVIGQVLMSRSGQQPAEAPRDRAAEVLARYGLAGPGSEEWTRLYEHIGGVVAAALTIARRMELPCDEVEQVRVGALLHDATKRYDVERHGELASSAENTDLSLTTVMREAGYSETVIAAAMNTGRDGRAFSSVRDRCASIRQRGVVAAIVGLADARSVGADFVSIEEAQNDYLARKKDSESEDFFMHHWKPYYEAVEDYLTELSAGLELGFSAADIYQEAVFPEVFGSAPSERLRQLYSVAPSAWVARTSMSAMVFRTIASGLSAFFRLQPADVLNDAMDMDRVGFHPDQGVGGEFAERDSQPDGTVSTQRRRVPGHAFTEDVPGNLVRGQVGHHVHGSGWVVFTALGHPVQRSSPHAGDHALRGRQVGVVDRLWITAQITEVGPIGPASLGGCTRPPARSREQGRQALTRSAERHRCLLADRPLAQANPPPQQAEEDR